MRVSCTENNISSEGRVGNLCDNVFVGESHNKPIFRGVVLVLVLGGQTHPRTVIGLSNCGRKIITAARQSSLFTDIPIFTTSNKTDCQRAKNDVRIDSSKQNQHTSSPFVFDLESLEVRLALLRLHESLRAYGGNIKFLCGARPPHPAVVN